MDFGSFSRLIGLRYMSLQSGCHVLWKASGSKSY